MFVQDQVVRDARGGGAEPDHLHDFSPFSSDHTETKVRVSIILCCIEVCALNISISVSREFIWHIAAKPLIVLLHCDTCGSTCGKCC